MRTTIAALLLCLSATTCVRAGEIDYLEDFALAADRTVPLKKLIPGTDEYYYYHSLHYLQTQQYAKVRELFGPWAERHQRTPRRAEIELRLALLSYGQNPQATRDFLRERLVLHFEHQQELLGQEPNLPTRLDPAQITRDAYLQRLFASNPDLNGIEPSALDWLALHPLDEGRQRILLQQLSRPDYPGLVKRIVADLNAPNSPGFGAYGIHNWLLQSQLDELLVLKPDLLNHRAFINAYLIRLQPGPDDDWRRDPQRREAYLQRLQTFVARLSPVHNSLKAHVLYHRLAADRARGVYDPARFLEYLKLPRPTGYMKAEYLALDANRGVQVDLAADYSEQTLLPAVQDDEPLVRSYLTRFFIDAADAKSYEPYVNDVYLKQLFAETKIVNGLGDPEQWASQLPAEQFRQLRDRVDLEFAHANRTDFSAEDPVSLELHLKNVGTLIVKVFEINAESYYRSQQKEIDTDLNLDGLVPNFEQTIKLGTPPLRRVTQKFDFPQLAKPGVYVVDFIGNGRSSRALVRKGRLQQVVRTTAGGQRFTVLDERNRKLNDAKIWLDGHEYAADKDGTILVPFAGEAQRRSIVISRGPLATLDSFQHEAESYRLALGVYVDRESLLTRKKAQAVLRFGVMLNGVPVSTKLLEEVELRIVSQDHDGITTVQKVPALPVYEDRETTHEFLTPARLASLQFIVTAKIRHQNLGKPIDVSAADSFAMNEIDRTEKIEDLLLTKSDGDRYVIEVLGRTGEPKASRPVQLSIKHRDFQAPLGVMLKTDATGRIELGRLPEIVAVTATGPEQTTRTWPIRDDSHRWPAALHGRVGEPLTLPYLGSAAAPERSEFSLIELRGGAFAADRFDALKIQDGQLRLEGLGAGDYDLWIKHRTTPIRVRVVEGPREGVYVLGDQRQLETDGLPRLQIASVKADDKLRIRLAGSSPVARVHLFATRFVPAFSAFDRLSQVGGAEPYVVYPGRASSTYVTGRNIGDEYRYILDRQYAQKFPGNMLERPSLLLNPWAVRSTATGRVTAEGGDDFQAKAESESGAAERGEKPAETAGVAGDFSDLNFLADASVVLFNLTPDEQGVVELPIAALGPHQHVHVVAVDPLHTTYRSIALPTPKTRFVDLRLAAGLDPQGHFTQQKLISVVPAGKTFVMNDVAAGRFKAYDSLTEVYLLYNTLTQDPRWAEFSFILRWPRMKLDEKRELYSKHACHELNLFLAKKDPEFFQQTIRPYLANKKHKTFVDRWLLEDRLDEFLQPWNHGRLNVAERILLARKLEGQRPPAARHVDDLFGLLPPNLDEFIRLFDTAVKGDALETTDPTGLVRQIDGLAVQDQVERLQDVDELAERPVMLNGAIGGMGGGMGGMGGKAGSPPPPAPASDGVPETAGLAKADRQDEAAKLQLNARRDLRFRMARGRGLKELQDSKHWDLDRSEDGGAGEKDRTDWFDSSGIAQGRQFFRQLDPTMEWAENNYHHLPIDQQTAELIRVNAFWRDFARHDPAQPFQSTAFASASTNFTEMMLALALLDLPFESPKHETKFEGARMTMVAGGPTIVFHEEVRPAAAPAGAKVLVSQNFFRFGDRQREENGETIDKYVEEEFLIQTVYGGHVVVTNPTSARQKLAVLIQVPLGSIPVLNTQATKTVYLTLEPYHTQTLDYHFYFPAAGRFAQFPVHVAKNEQLVAAASPFVFQVVAVPTKTDKLSWDYVSQFGTNDEVLAFLNKANVQQLNLDKIAFRMRDKAFFTATLKLLAERRVFQSTLWSYGLFHGDEPAIAQFLSHRDELVQECGGRIASPLLTIDPVARHAYEHLEYKPLVNARAHALGARRQIVNDRFHAQYHRFLRELSYERTPGGDDLLSVVYYLLLQDRIEEALAVFARVDGTKIATRLQYDYCDAYLKFFTLDLAGARAVAAKYADHPVDRWRATFRAVTAQLDEAEGKEAVAVDADDRNQQQSKLAATEPSFDFKVEGGRLTLDYQNLKSVQVNYYVMDVELLFSRNPFVQQFRGQFSAIRPNLTQTLTLPADKKTFAGALPEALANKNVLVEMVGGGQTKNQAYYSNSLQIQTIENYGQLRVTNAADGKPVAKAYVKVYARMADGEVKFYKDGYTDVRGRFDYASLSTDDLESAARFSILILSEQFGATVREAAPPAR